MVKVVFMYNLKPGIAPEKFEKWFYDVHVPDIMRYPGIRKFVANKVIGAPDGHPKYYRTAELHFDSLKAVQKAWEWRKENLLPYKERSPLEWIDISPIVYCKGEEIVP